MAHNYQPTDYTLYAEADDNEIFEPLYGEHVCLENAFSDGMMEELFQQLVNANYLLPITIQTGGGRNNVRFPDVQAYRGNPAALRQLQSSNQFKLSASIGGAEALREVQNYYDARAVEGHVWPGGRPVTLNAVNINLANFMWRYNHRRGVGFRKIPHTGEISHKAEGYSAAHPEWGSCKVEYTDMESASVNESRKQCTQFGLMWRRPNGSLLDPENPNDAAYTGPTQCFHGSYNSPCYAPHPLLWIGPTGATINVRKPGGKKRQQPEKPVPEPFGQGGGQQPNKRGGKGSSSKPAKTH